MKKTFYSVEYAVWGAPVNGVKWFDKLEDAKEFAKRDYTDNVKTHTFKSTEKINEIEKMIAFQNCKM